MPFPGLLPATTGAAALLGIAAASPAYAGVPHPGDACALLTEAQVSAALGVKVVAGKHLIPNSTNVCAWSPTGGPTGKKLVITIMSVDHFQRGKSPMHGITKTPVKGIGDDAYYIETPGLGTGLNVKKGDFFVQLRVSGEGMTPALEEAAEKVLAIEALAKA